MTPSRSLTTWASIIGQFNFTPVAWLALLNPTDTWRYWRPGILLREPFGPEPFARSRVGSVCESTTDNPFLDEMLRRAPDVSASEISPFDGSTSPFDVINSER